MRRFLLILLLVTGCWFVVVSPVLAQNCNQTPEFKGPFYPYLFSKQEDDCGLCKVGSPCWEDYLDHAVVKCIAKPDVQPELVIGQFDFILRHGASKQVSLGTTNIANISVDSPVLQENFIDLYKHLMSFNMADQLDSARYASECVFQGITDPAQCAQNLGLDLQLQSGKTITNTLIASSSYQRTASLPQKIADKRARAEQILRCTSQTPPPNDMLCDNYYCADNDLECKQTSIDIAHLVLTVSTPADYNALSRDDQLLFDSLKDIKAAQHLTEVVKRIEAVDGTYDYQLSDADNIVIGYGSIPMLPQVLNASIKTVQKYSRLEDGQGLYERLRQETYRPVDHSLPPEEQIRQKIENAPCQIESPPTQFFGGTANSRGTGVSFSWIFNILASIEKAANTSQHPYIGYRLEPWELYGLARLYGSDKLAFNRRTYSAKTEGFDDQVNIPDPYVNSNPNAETDPNDTSPPRCPTPRPGETETDCDTEKPPLSQIIYKGDQPDQIPLDGGEAVHINKLQFLQGKAYPLKNPENAQRACEYFKWAESMLSTLGTPIASLLEVPEAFANLSSCANYLSSGSLPATYAGNYTCPISVDQMRQAGMGSLPNPPPNPPSDYLQFYNWIEQGSGFPPNSHTNTSVLPDPESIGCLINYAQAFWTGSRFTPDNINQVIAWAQQHNWNPSLLLSFWLEESHAGAASPKEFGCGASGVPGGGYDQQLACLETINMSSYPTFARFLCAFAGDCPENETQDTNPNFPAFVQFYNILTQSGVWQSP